MDESMLVQLTEVTERAKSNTHQIDEMKEDIKNIMQEQKAIYELTSSIKLMGAEMVGIREDIAVVKEKQDKLTDKIDAVEQEPFTKHKKLVNTVITSIVTAIVTGVAIAVINMILNNGIQL